MSARLGSGLLVGVVVLLSSSVCASAADLQLTGTLGGAQPGPGTRTIPYFGDSFSFNGITYPYSMVGTNPRTSQATTTVPAVIVPLRFVFADGQVADIGSAVRDVIASPLFQSARFKSGTTQYGDAIRRAMFWSYDAKTDYHVLLGQPAVLATQTISVPQGAGSYVPAGTPIVTIAGVQLHAAVPLGVVDARWLHTALDRVLSTLNIGPISVAILLSRNVVENDGVPGEHSAQSFTAGGNGSSGAPSGSEAIQTEIWASYGDPYYFAEVPNLGQNVDILSHEVSEWLHNPFFSNTIPSWRSPLPFASAFYGCSTLLETGDPVLDAAFTVDGYQLQDETFLSWFAHEVPSIGIDGDYSYLGTFTQPAPTC